MTQQRRGRGEGSIRQRSDGRWEARLTLPESGGVKSFYAKTRPEARAKLTAALRDMDLGAPLVKDERLTVERYLADWLERKRADLRPRTHRRYRELMAHVSRAVGGLALTKLTPTRLDRLYSTLQKPPAGVKAADAAKGAASVDGTPSAEGQAGAGLSSTTVHHIHVTLRQALDDAERLGLVARNAADQVRGPRMRQSEMHTLDLAQSRELLTAARSERLEALYVLALTTGMREGELLALRWRDVDLDKLEAGELQVRGTLVYVPGDGHHIGPPKTARSRRRIDLDPEAVAALRRHKARQAQERLAAGAVWAHGAVAPDLVFCNEIGGPLDAVGLLRNRFHPLLERAGLPRIRFHDLRHTAATLMLLQGINPKVVSERLGHASVAITLDRYSHVLPSMQRDAAKVLGRALFG